MINNTGPSASGTGSNVGPDQGPVTGPDEVWAERTPTATGEIDISVAYANPPTDELMALYAAWAESYDADLTDVYGYRAPADAVAALIALDVPRHARILDAGCGTGQAGTLLAAAGYTHVDGADLSPEMRAVAARLGVYRHLFDLDMTADYAPQLAAANGAANAKIGDDGAKLSDDRAADARLDTPHDARPGHLYDAVICVGVFGYGPPHIDDLPRIMHAARPGAPVLVTVNGMGWVKMGWEAALAPTLKAAGVELRARIRIRHMVNEGIHAELLNLRRR